MVLPRLIKSPSQEGDLGGGWVTRPTLQKKTPEMVSFFVEVAGVEPASKQGAQELSTRLVAI